MLISRGERRKGKCDAYSIDVQSNTWVIGIDWSKDEKACMLYVSDEMRSRLLRARGDRRNEQTCYFMIHELISYGFVTRKVSYGTFFKVIMPYNIIKAKLKFDHKQGIEIIRHSNIFENLTGEVRLVRSINTFTYILKVLKMIDN